MALVLPVLLLLNTEHCLHRKEADGTQGTTAALNLHVIDSDAVFQRALEANAMEIYPLGDQFYGDRAGRCAIRSGSIGLFATRFRNIAAFQEMLNQ